MDTHYGKYQGPLAALTERWILEGFHPGDAEWTNSDIGEGAILWRGPHELTYEESKWLRTEFECTDEDLDLLDADLQQPGIAHSWDSQGFIYAWPLATVTLVEKFERDIAETNARFDEDEEA